MRLIDLHTHTTASDGSFTPSEVCQLAIDKNLAAIAITDHDTVSGVAEAVQYGAEHSADIEIIPGVEVSCEYQGREIHILGYYMDYMNPALSEPLDAVKEARLKRTLDMCRLFQEDGIDMTLEKLQAGNPKTVITRAHFARVLLEEGICKTKDQVFKSYIGEKNKYYIPNPNISCEEAMRIITTYGKAAFLAHPLLYKLGYQQIEELIVYLKSLGLTGIEAYHSSNNSYESDRLRNIAAKHGLLVSGGTDFHGVIKPDIQLGSGRGGMRITEGILTRIKEAL